MFLKTLSGSSLALLFAVSPLLAQEEVIDVSASTPITDTVVTTDVVETTEEDPIASSFFLPGGYGYLPETIVPGTGLYTRPPVDFTLTIEQGYNDNIYSSSGEPGDAPKKGSGVTEAYAGVNLLLKSPRSFFSLGTDLGAVYYWDREGDEVSPVGRLNLVNVYKASERLYFSSRVFGGYFTQPNITQPNITRATTGDYFDIRGLFDVQYRWTPIFSTITTFGAGTRVYRESEADIQNYFDYSVGQQFRYLFTPRFSGIADFRFAQSLYYHSGDRDSMTEIASLGFDWLMTPRLTSTFRGGVTFRQFELDGASDKSAPFFETGLGYRYGQGSMLQWTGRFGFEEGNWVDQSIQAARTGLSVTQVLTPRLSAYLGAYYVYEFRDQLIANLPDVDDQQFVNASVRLQYAINRSFTVFGAYSHTQCITDNDFNEYKQNEYTMGVTYRF